MEITITNSTKAFLAAATLGLLLTNVAYAQEAIETLDREATLEARAELRTDNEALRAEARTEAQASSSANREAVQAERTANQEARRAAISDRAKERITNLAANVSNRMEAAIARLQNVINRLDSRMDKLAAAGLDVTEAKQILASAQTSLDVAVADIATIDADVKAAVTAESPREAWQTVKAKYQSIRDQLRTAHTEIKAAVQALKDAAKAADGRGASTTISSDTAAETTVEDGNTEAAVISETAVQTAL